MDDGKSPASAKKRELRQCPHALLPDETGNAVRPCQWQGGERACSTSSQHRLPLILQLEVRLAKANSEFRPCLKLGKFKKRESECACAKSRLTQLSSPTLRPNTIQLIVVRVKNVRPEVSICRKAAIRPDPIGLFALFTHHDKKRRHGGSARALASRVIILSRHGQVK